MSAYGYEMERALSAQSLLSRGGSESDSRSTMETGVYMSPFAATVFIGGLVTVGVSVLTLLIAMTMMLQTCQSQRDGVVEMQKLMENREYCRIMVLHFELNSLDTSSLPLVCKELAVQNLQDGHYMRELKNALNLAESYFSNIKPGEDGKDVVLMDLDDLIPPGYFSMYLSLSCFFFSCNRLLGCIHLIMHFSYHTLTDVLFTKSHFWELPFGVCELVILLISFFGLLAFGNSYLSFLAIVFSYCRFSHNTSDDVKDALQLTQPAVQQMYKKLRDDGWKLILLSRKHERLRNTMVEYLVSVGCGGWFSMIMSLDDEMQRGGQEYLSMRRSTIQKQGFRIIGAISRQLDFLTGPRHGGSINFKLPDAMF